MTEKEKLLIAALEQILNRAGHHDVDLRRIANDAIKAAKE
jgi:hypothetical protein